MKVLITGANGFLGRNLQLHLAGRGDVSAVCFTREHRADQLASMLQGVDCVFHLAGVNRPQDPVEFAVGNAALTRELCHALVDEVGQSGKRIPVIFTSSVQADLENLYGESKRDAENALFDMERSHGIDVHVFRLPNVFGKWSRPNSKSVVSTFCHNIARDFPMRINDPAAAVTLVYVDDVIERFIQIMDGADAAVDAHGFATLTPQYTTTVGELAHMVRSFKDSRMTLVTERVGCGFSRALYATYMSYLPPESFTYSVPKHGDARGVFVELLKTPDCGQFSFFTAHPGITRGGHYHHTKTEKFLVIKGRARFKFRHMQTGATHELETSEETAEIVETVPGWTHDITNVGSVEMLVLLWANEVFDRTRPDTYDCPL